VLCCCPHENPLARGDACGCGFELARRFRATREGRRVLLVAVTGFGQPEDRGRAIDAGFDAHLVKPINPDVLAAIIASAAERRERPDA